MPMVIKRDETGKDPKAKKADASGSAAKSAAKASPKAASGAKKKGSKSEPNEMPKLIIAGTVTVFALGFLLWWFVFSGGPAETPTPGSPVDGAPTGVNKLGATGGTGGTGGTGANTGNRAGGISTGEGAAPSGKGGLNKLGGTEGGDTGENIP